MQSLPESSLSIFFCLISLSIERISFLTLSNPISESSSARHSSSDATFGSSNGMSSGRMVKNVSLPTWLSGSALTLVPMLPSTLSSIFLASRALPKSFPDFSAESFERLEGFVQSATCKG